MERASLAGYWIMGAAGVSRCATMPGAHKHEKAEIPRHETKPWDQTMGKEGGAALIGEPAPQAALARQSSGWKGSRF